MLWCDDAALLEGRFLPGNAWAAASASTPVSATLAAIIQRLAELSLRSAASRVWELWRWMPVI